MTRQLSVGKKSSLHLCSYSEVYRRQLCVAHHRHYLRHHPPVHCQPAAAMSPLVFRTLDSLSLSTWRQSQWRAVAASLFSWASTALLDEIMISYLAPIRPLAWPQYLFITAVSNCTSRYIPTLHCSGAPWMIVSGVHKVPTWSVTECWRQVLKSCVYDVYYVCHIFKVKKTEQQRIKSNNISYWSCYWRHRWRHQTIGEEEDCGGRVNWERQRRRLLIKKKS